MKVTGVRSGCLYLRNKGFYSQERLSAQPSFLRFPCGFLCERRAALRPVDADFAPTETDCKILFCIVSLFFSLK